MKTAKALGLTIPQTLLQRGGSGDPVARTVPAPGALGRGAGARRNGSARLPGNMRLIHLAVFLTLTLVPLAPRHSSGEGVRMGYLAEGPQLTNPARR